MKHAVKIQAPAADRAAIYPASRGAYDAPPSLPVEPEDPPALEPIALQFRLNIEEMRRFFKAAPKDGIRLEHTDQMEQALLYVGEAMELAMRGRQWRPRQ